MPGWFSRAAARASRSTRSPAPALARDRLDGHLALELLVPGQPDHAEAARAQPALQAVAPEHQRAASGEPLGGLGAAAWAACWARRSRLLSGRLISDSCSVRDRRVLPPGHTPTAPGGASPLGSAGVDRCPSSTNRTSPTPLHAAGHRAVAATDRQTMMVRRTIAVGGGAARADPARALRRGCLDARKERAIEDYADDADGAGAGVERPEQGAVRAARGRRRRRTRRWTPRTGERLPRPVGVARGPRARPRRARTRLSQRPALPARDARVPPRRPGRGSPTTLPGRARRRGAPPGLRGRGAPDAGLPGQRRDLRGPLQARPQEVLADEDVTGATVAGERLPAGHRVAATRLRGRPITGVRAARRAASEATAGPPRQRPRRRVASAAWRSTPGGSATVPLAADLAFEVQVANQGENTETDVDGEGDRRRGRRRHRARGARSTRSPRARRSA